MRYERILMDIEVQRDFFAPGGSCYSPAAAECAERIYRLFRWAARYNVPVISTVLRVRPREHGPLAAVPHCVEGTRGEQKMLRTVLPWRIDLGLRSSTDVPVDLFENYQQAIFEKRRTDVFGHAAADRLICDIEAATFVVCGAGLAHGVFEAAFGLRKRGFGVVVATDAVLDLGSGYEPTAQRRMEEKGVLFAPSDQIVRVSPRRLPDYLRRRLAGSARSPSEATA